MDCKVWVLIASGSLASTIAAPVLAADPGFYFSAAVGRAEEHPGASPGATFIGSTGIMLFEPDRVDVDTGDVAWSATVGYRINRYVAVEVEYMHLGTTKTSEHYSYDATPQFPSTPAEITLTYSSKVTGPALSVLGSVPFSNGFDVFVRAGVFFLDRDVQRGPGSDTFGSTVWLGGAGASWSFASRWTVRAEYQRTGKADAASAADTDLERVSLSVLYRL